MSSLEIGIVGIPNAGKTTLFNALSRAGAQVASFPFTTVEPNVGVVPVPDPRLEKIAALAGCERKVPATVRFVDIAGLVEGASRGEGLGNKFLARIREVDAVLHVVRAFDEPDIAHVAGSVDPVRDAELVDTEIRLADLEHLSRLVEKAKRDAKKGDKVSGQRLNDLLSLQRIVEEGQIDQRDSLVKELAEKFRGEGILSLKPTIIALNIGENDDTESLVAKMLDWANPRGIVVIPVCARVEAELAELPPEEALEFEKELGIDEESLARVIRAGYQLLGLITYFSIDSGECRAWALKRGSTALKAAGKIHTDFEKGFIKAEVVHYEDFLRCGNFHQAREAGCLLVEGKEYIVQDGDVIHFKFSK